MRASPGADRSHPSAGTRWRKNYRAFRPCGPLDKFGIERAARRGAAAPFRAGDSDGKVRFRSCGARWESAGACAHRSEEHTSELQSLMLISYAVFCSKKKKEKHTKHPQ